MYREIRKKRLILENRKPFSAEITQKIHEINLIDMIYSALRLSGDYLTRENIKSMLDGNMVREATIRQHQVIENYRKLQIEMESLCEMKNKLSLRTLKELYGCMMGISECEYRVTNPILKEFSYNPPHFQEIEEQMQILMAWVSKENEGETTNELLKIAHFHNRLIEVYPFEEGTEELARVAVLYYMMTKGYPVFAFNFSEQEYNVTITKYMSKEEIEPFYSGLERSLFNKLELLLQMTEES